MVRGRLPPRKPKDTMSTFLTDARAEVKPSSRLAIAITDSNGKITRWGDDEDSAGRIPTGLTFSTSIPGGFNTLSATLNRRINFDYSDLGLFDNIKVYGAGNRTVWEGRQAYFPRSHAESDAITVNATGWITHLTDDQSFREIYVSRDMSGWVDAPFWRRNQLLNAGTWHYDFSSSAGSDPVNGYPVLTQAATRYGGVNSIGEAFYDTKGIPLSRIYYDLESFDRGSGSKKLESVGGWNCSALLGTPNLSSFVNTSNLAISQATAKSGYLATTDPTYKTAIVQVYNSTFGTAADGEWNAYWRKLAVYGQHGLPLYGTDPKGVLGSDVVADIVRRTAPRLNFTQGPSGSIQSTDYAIDHLAFPDPGTGHAAIERVNGYHLWDWGVYDSREFFFRRPDPGRLTWEARTSDGAHLTLEGDQIDSFFNGVVIQYSDGLESYSVGPPGATTSFNSAALADANPDNPVNSHGIDRKWAILNISVPTTLNNAIQIGQMYLAEHAVPQRRGSITLREFVRHPSIGIVPSHWVRAGDYIQVSDFPADVPRKIISTNYAHDTRTMTCDLENTVFRLDAILERLAADLVGVM